MGCFLARKIPSYGNSQECLDLEQTSTEAILICLLNFGLQFCWLKYYIWSCIVFYCIVLVASSVHGAGWLIGRFDAFCLKGRDSNSSRNVG